MKWHLAAAAALLLTACGNDQNKLLDPSLVTELFKGRQEPVAQTPQQTATMVARALTALKEPVMLGILEDRKATAILVPYGRNGRVETWTTEEFQTLSFRDGVLTATRGLGTDLMSADTAPVAAALRQGGGDVRRSWQTMDAALGDVTVTATCRVRPAGQEVLPLASGATVATRKMTEACDNGASNAYWLTADGMVVQSRQWVGPEAGYLTQQILRR